MSNPIIKAFQSPSRPNAIRGQCYDCMGGHKSDKNTLGSICERVRDCHIKRCPLWTLRPWRDADQKQKDLETARSLGDERRNIPSPHEHDALLSKAYSSPTSNARCIKAKCWDCVGGAADAAPRLRVRDCETTDCPIYPVRPWQTLKGRT